MIVSVVILSYSIDEVIYRMNLDCIQSLMQSEDWQSDELEIILIESNTCCDYEYPLEVTVLVPDEPFNFHRFLNIGIRSSHGELIALCNNDILFHKGWYSELQRVKELHPEFLCFSPIDRAYETMSEDHFPSDNDFYIGWDNKWHFSAWCFVIDRKLIDKIGYLDECFDFYGADDDFLMLLRKYAIANVLLTHSEVRHLSQVVTKQVDENRGITELKPEAYPIPEKYLKWGYSWLWSDKRHYDAFYRLLDKWGNPKMIKRVNRLLDRYPFFRKETVTRCLYNKQVINLLAKLTGL